MIFTETHLKGAFVVEIEKHEDVRGFFTRVFCQEEFAEHGLNTAVAQCNISHNIKKGTIRGMHYQSAPYQEAKFIRCIQGSLYDVIVDLRPLSPTYCQWFGVELSAANYKALYVPEDFAHGFQTLEDNTNIMYQVSQFYHPESAQGVRWNDTAFNIEWPLPVAVIMDRDDSYPDFIK